MRTSDGVKKLIKDRGLRQVWIVDQMNRIAPELSMSKTKLSAIVCGGRKMTGFVRCSYSEIVRQLLDDGFAMRAAERAVQESA